MDKIRNEDEYLTVQNEELRKEFFNNYIKSISEACGHQHGSLNSGNKHKKKDKKKRKKRDDVRLY